ncbi:MAG TPA: hypothetical protein VFQ79_22990 [Bryobacteraceae bacterium]|nr:hypothetical protein [Bryobacteraceae bacterium]
MLPELKVVLSFLTMGVYTASLYRNRGGILRFGARGGLYHRALRPSRSRAPVLRFSTLPVRQRHFASVALAIFDGGPSDTAALLIEKTGSFDLAILVAGVSLLVGVAAYLFLLQERGVTLFPLDEGTCGSA